jgi:hypothetical protein
MELYNWIRNIKLLLLLEQQIFRELMLIFLDTLEATIFIMRHLFAIHFIMIWCKATAYLIRQKLI